MKKLMATAMLSAFTLGGIVMAATPKMQSDTTKKKTETTKKDTTKKPPVK
ncbi:MAG: hypothetical protein ACTHNW_07900 [Mucilaginibacter sp.]